MEVRWADLPPELLATISAGLPEAIDVIRFRVVCRSWRISTSPPSNKLSLFFPLRRFFPNLALNNSQRLTINAAAVYLLWPRSDPSKPWLVSLQESVPGKLVPRHALRYDKKYGGDYSVDLSSDYWISATRICRFFESSVSRKSKNSLKVVFAWNSGCLVGLRKIKFGISSELFAFRLDLSNGGDSITSTPIRNHCPFQDFVKFNGRIYVVDKLGNMYVFLDTHLMLRKVKSLSFCGGDRLIRFVVSDGDLYLVLRNHWLDDGCQIYKLERTKRDRRWKGVGDLGDRVFFIAHNCSFWVRAPLPPPWKPNSVVCFPDRNHDFEVFQFGGGNHPFTMTKTSSTSQGHSDLFAPPSSWIDIQRDLDSRRRLKA